MFSLISAWINGWVNNREGGDLRRDRAHYVVIVMYRSDAKVSDRYLIDVDPRVFAFLDVITNPNRLIV